MQAFRALLGQTDMIAYLAMMTPRLLEAALTVVEVRYSQIVEVRYSEIMEERLRDPVYRGLG